MNLFDIGKFIRGRPLSVFGAKMLIGKQNVLTRKGAKCKIPYTVGDLKAVKGKGEWALMCKSGKSLAELHYDSPDEFCEANIWTSNPSAVLMQLFECSEQSYRLICLKPMTLAEAKELWPDQVVVPANLATVAELMIMLKDQTGRVILEREFHEVIVGDLAVRLGGNNSNGILLYVVPAKDLKTDPAEFRCLYCIAPRQ